ncbi:MAG: T9SS type A sorting domain-containing protein [Cytophagaceae bacterium]
MNDTITVNSSEIGVTYTPMKGATAVGGAVSGTGGNIDLIISSAGLSVGGNIISIQASNGSCPAINLTSNSSLTYDNSTVSTAFTTGNQICGTNPVVVSVPAVNNSYQWFLNGSKIIGATAPTYGVVAPGNYLAQVVNSFGCAISTGPMFIGAITPPVIIPSGGAGNDTLLSVSVPGATSYQWYAYGGQKAIVGETGSSYRPYFLSDYMIGANINGCRILSNPYTLNNSSMSMLTRQNFMMTDSTIYISGPAVASAIADIYPNPSFGKFTLNYQCHSSKEVEIKVFNAVGLLIAEKNFASHSGIISANFDEFNFKPGMYMISITEDNEKSEVRRLMIY